MLLQAQHRRGKGVRRHPVRDCIAYIGTLRTNLACVFIVLVCMCGAQCYRQRGYHFAAAYAEPGNRQWLHARGLTGMGFAAAVARVLDHLPRARRRQQSPC
uniref:hypothetical protein n=1 Tax=Xanthomonas fragariae TaxID=48664 RepID=UPI001F371196